MRRGNPVYYICFKCFTKQVHTKHIIGDIHNIKDTDILRCPNCGYTFTRKDHRELMQIRQ